MQMNNYLCCMIKQEKNMDIIGRMMFLTLFFILMLAFPKNTTSDYSTKHYIYSELCCNNSKEAICCDVIQVPLLQAINITVENKSTSFDSSFQLKINSIDRFFSQSFKLQHINRLLIKSLSCSLYCFQKLPSISDEIPIFS